MMLSFLFVRHCGQRDYLCGMNSQELLLKKLDRPDHWIFEKIIELFRQAFEMGGAEGIGGSAEGLPDKPGAAGGSYLTGLLERPGFIVFAALYQHEIVGGLTAYELPMYYSEESEIYIYDIAVSASFQRKGVGKAILSALLAYCRKSGVRSVFVDADETDEHALDFYHATGGKAAGVVHFTYII
jgi:aminoglycoside 3-N-acetyltransferase I